MEQLTMQQLAEKQSEIEQMVYKITGVRSEENMKEYTGYETRQQIPTEALPGLLRELKSELRCMEILGKERYAESRSIGGKIALYQNIFGATIRTLAMEREKQPVTWQEFRRMLAVEMEKLGKKSVFEQPFEFLGDTWGKEITECTVGTNAKPQAERQSSFEKPSIEL